MLIIGNVCVEFADLGILLKEFLNLGKRLLESWIARHGREFFVDEIFKLLLGCDLTYDFATAKRHGVFCLEESIVARAFAIWLPL